MWSGKQGNSPGHKASALPMAYQILKKKLTFQGTCQMCENFYRIKVDFQ
jgi:hypothetical protein